MVLDFISDPRNNPKWFHGTLEMRRVPEGNLAVGKTVEAVVQFRGRPLVVGARCILMDQNRELTWEFISGPTKGSTDNWKMEPVDEKSTRLTRAYDLKASGSWKLVQPVVARGTRSAHKEEIANVKRIMEGKPEGSGSRDITGGNTTL